MNNKINKMKKSNIVKKALNFAKKKHEGQFRADKKTPYITHPIRVAEILKKFKKSHRIDELVAAALLHDTLEDTKTGIEEIRREFGETIALLVIELTNDLWAIKTLGKKNYHCEKLSSVDKISSWALTIKLADRLDNVSDLKKVPKGKKWTQEYGKQTKEIVNYISKNRKLSKTQKILINEILKLVDETQGLKN
jgi:(p)ppGpp synthase/HD superfamily hydrolase